MEEQMDFGELKNDTNFVETITALSEQLKDIDEYVTKCVGFPNIDKFTPEEKVKFDLNLLYTMNSLYYMHVKLQGMDPNEHGIKNELSRVRQAMLREKQFSDKKLRPTIDKAAAGRFIKHGIHYKEKNQNDENNSNDEPSTSKKSTVDKNIEVTTLENKNDKQKTNNKNNKKKKNNKNNTYIVVSDDSSDEQSKSKKKSNQTIDLTTMETSDND